MLGVVKSFNKSSCTGTIRCDSTGEEILFSLPAVASQNYKLLHEGQRVSFYVEQGSQGDGYNVATKVTAVD